MVESCDREFFTRTALIRHGAKMHEDVDFSIAPKIYKRRVRKDGPGAYNKRRRTMQNEPVSNVFVDDDDGLSDEDQYEEDDSFCKVEEEVIEEGQSGEYVEDDEYHDDDDGEETKEEIIEVYQGEDMSDAYIIQMEDGEIIEELKEGDVEEDIDYI